MGKLEWFSFDKLDRLKMPFSAHYVISHWLNKGKYTTDIYGGIANGTEVVFTELPAF